jgi:hypothetical protein
VALIAQSPDRYGFDRQQRFVLRDDLDDEESRFAALEQLIGSWQDHRGDDAQRGNG